jgi:glycosyltransferase involved in cell wall biosynthesis
MESWDAPILLVTDQPPLSGIGTYATRLHGLLHESFPRLEVRNLHYFPYDPVPPHQPVLGQRYARSRWSALRALRANERSLVGSLGGSPPLVHLCGASYDLARELDRPIATVHDFGLRTLRSLRSVDPGLVLVEGYSLVEWLRTPRFLRRCRARVTISTLTERRLREWTGLPSTVIPHWVDPERFRPRPPVESRSRLGLPLDRRIVLNVSSGGAYKNHALLRDVVAALPPGYLLVKVGYPLTGLGGRVRNEGLVAEDRYPEYFAAADLYLHLSVREGFGLPLVEALASETPVVALANPPAPEILGEGAALLPSASSAPTIAAQVRSVVENPAIASDLRRRGRTQVARYAPAVARARYVDLYASALRS